MSDAYLRERIQRVIHQATGLREEFASPLASRILDELNRHFRGERIYFSLSNEQRDAAIRERFNGRNRDELIREYDISRATFYRVIGERPCGP